MAAAVVGEGQWLDARTYSRNGSSAAPEHATRCCSLSSEHDLSLATVAKKEWSGGVVACAVLLVLGRLARQRPTGDEATVARVYEVGTRSASSVLLREIHRSLRVWAVWHASDEQQRRQRRVRRLFGEGLPPCRVPSTLVIWALSWD
jgi:hypothetical protein